MASHEHVGRLSLPSGGREVRAVAVILSGVEVSCDATRINLQIKLFITFGWMKWINAAGLILQFISFWLAAPELLGPTTLRRFEKGLKLFISSLPLIIVWIVIIAYGLFFSITGIVKGIKAGEGENVDYYSFFIPLIICTVVYFFFVIFNRKIKTLLEKKLAQPLIEKLINNNETRKNLLIVGAVLFTAGFLMQLVVIVTGQ